MYNIFLSKLYKQMTYSLICLKQWFESRQDQVFVFFSNSGQLWGPPTLIFTKHQV